MHFSRKYKCKSEALAGNELQPLFKIFKSAGYRVYAYSPVCRIHAALVDRLFAPSIVLADLSLEKTVLKKSFLPCLQGYDGEDDRADKLLRLKLAGDIASEKTDQPKFVFFHFMMPHSPFVFDVHGGPVAFENRENYVDPQYYVDQLLFLNTKIEELVSTILGHDPSAAILIQSDHGIRFIDGIQEDEKRACLNALYAPDAVLPIEGLTRINTLRLALKHVLGLNLELYKD
jgi:hypothetical protein